MISEVKKLEYDMRFRTFMRQMFTISRMKPKEKYLYRLMDGVPFKDLETAILITRIDYDKNAANDR
ncbi:MAG: hypothetical protein DI626_08540 [Micavibrio aeruginosavorus]|uniref:Uncharacterized protein n=1 Tax=Micavibrio aeruginosavorus TaxID=349221 RepID=A0A2W4ZPA0_9BACT|nr:MAG: hypothetical protein DI626_08540 [Micavibrio aeruginosavorus]